MFDPDDLFNSEGFSVPWCEDDEDSSTIAKKSQILDAVLANHIDSLRSLLDSPEWYNVRNKLGYNILQITIFLDRLVIFDYLLSIPDFPLEYSNKDGETALVVAFGSIHELPFLDEHYAYELLKRGSCADVICFKGNTPLHCAFQASYCRVAKFLIKQGVDLDARNDDGETPLEVATGYWFQDADDTDLQPMLLMYGATPTLRAFEYDFVLNKPFEIQENLFLYTFDEHFDEEISLHFILKLAKQKSPFFHELIKYPVYVEHDDSYNVSDACFNILCSMSVDYLKIMIERFSSYLRQVLATMTPNFSPTFLCIENLNMMIESELKPDVISLLSNISIILASYFIKPRDVATVTERYCFCLSYGLNISEKDLQRTYIEFGYCELFRILLYMDIPMDLNSDSRNIAAALFYDMSLDFEQVVKNVNRFSSSECKSLVCYFANHRLREMYLKYVDDGIIEERENLPQVPLLIELARNTFRRLFIKTLHIKTSRRFYTRLNSLPFSTVYKKIISYEMKLY